jgi:Protein of unknown function (DUF5818)
VKRFLKHRGTLFGLGMALLLSCANAQTAPAQPQDPTASAPAGQAPSTNSPTLPSEATSAENHPYSPRAKSRPFMGRVVRERSGYVLRAGGLEYKLDDQEAARDYAGRNVKIMGNLDRQSNTIHVQTIENSPSL